MTRRGPRARHCLGLHHQRAETGGVDRLERDKLHEVYFADFSAAYGPSPALAQAIKRDFGSQARRQAEFVAMGKALGGGSGWVLLTWSPRDGRLVNTWAADHTMTLAGGTPRLALDIYEHAYHMDYGSNAGAYVEAFMKVAS